MESTPLPHQAPDPLRQAVTSLEENPLGDTLATVIAPLADRLDQGSLRDMLRGNWLGHAAHPMLTDLPLGCFMSATILDLVGGKRSEKAAQQLIGVGLLTLPAVAATGMVDWKEASSDPRIRRVGAIHGVGNAVAGMVYFRSWRARRKGHRVRGMLMALVGGLLALFTGYLGGHLSFARQSGTGERGLSPGRPTTQGTDNVRPQATEGTDSATIDLVESVPISS